MPSDLRPREQKDDVKNFDFPSMNLHLQLSLLDTLEKKGCHARAFVRVCIHSHSLPPFFDFPSICIYVWSCTEIISVTLYVVVNCGTPVCSTSDSPPTTNLILGTYASFVSP